MGAGIGPSTDGARPGYRSRMPSPTASTLRVCVKCFLPAETFLRHVDDIPVLERKICRHSSAHLGGIHGKRGSAALPGLPCDGDLALIRKARKSPRLEDPLQDRRSPR